MFSTRIITLTLTFLTTLIHAADVSSHLDKPPLVNNLDYMAPGLMDNFPIVHSTYKPWSAGWIPKDCKDEAESAGQSAQDITTYDVQYDDCNTAWVMCYHKNSGRSFDEIVALFGRIPVRARSFVRHVLTLPDTAAHAYNAGGNIVMFETEEGGLGFEVFLHETGHSLDLLNAYTRGQLSSSQNWLDNYNQDPNVPDPYSQTNQIEDVAQNTVVAAYNVQVPGGYGSLEPRSYNIFHQYATVQTWQRESGDLLVPNGQCGKRLTNSEPVSSTGSSRSRKREERLSRRAAAAAVSEKPDVSLGEGIQVIPPREFSTAPQLEKRADKPDVSLGPGIEVIPPKDFHTGKDCTFGH